MAASHTSPIQARRHRCPAPQCRVQVPGGQLVCRDHWRLVPQRLRQRLYATWRGGAGAGSPEHRDAMAAVIESLGAVLEDRGS